MNCAFSAAIAVTTFITSILRCVRLIWIISSFFTKENAYLRVIVVVSMAMVIFGIKPTLTFYGFNFSKIKV